MTNAPENFDWVTARSKCSAADMYAVLSKEARANMLARNEILDQSGDRDRFRFKARSDGFTIHDTWGTKRRAVDFYFKGSQISWVPTVDDIATQTVVVLVTLNDEGQCKFKIGDDQLDVWQVLKRALESLFFDAPVAN